MSWTLDDDPYAKGHYGYALYGSMGLLQEVTPYHEDSAGEITVNQDIKRIIFNNGGSSDGLLININITKNGLKKNFRCTNCLPNSPSLQLGRLYLDGNINGGFMNLPNTANCEISCEFVLGKSF